MATNAPEGEMIPLRPNRLSQTPTPPNVLPRSRPPAPVPTGLSSKELARLRAEALTGGSPQQSRNGPSANVSHSESPSSPEDAVIESGEATPSLDTRRLHSEFESLLRRQMERLRARRPTAEAPPSYHTEDR